MSEVSVALQRLIEVRGRNLPVVQREIARWQAIDAHLDELQAAVADLKAHAFTGGDAGDLTVPRVAELRLGIAEVVEVYRVLAARFSRATINIGVSGAARMGKSTLLQAVSGLGDDQIPTADGIPVTAVRSKIYHAPVRRAELRMHTAGSFLAEVIAPYHAGAGLPQVPRSIEEFRRWEYPPADDNDSEIRGALIRLRECQSSLATYEGLLTGGTRAIDLHELRRYVAYPTSEERDPAAGPVARRHLAVREARVECPFPNAEDVTDLAIIDLPGLGDLAPDAEGRHVEGLRNEVDAVLLVKRASDTSSYWGKADVNTMKLLDVVRGFIRSDGEFAFIVLNRNTVNPKLNDDLRGDILLNVNEGQDGRHITVFETDVRDAAAVHEDVLAPLLRRLSTGLPTMDREGLAWATGRAEDIAAGILTALGDLGGTLRTVRDPVGVPEEVIELKADQLRTALARRLGGLVAEMTAAVEGGDSDDGFAKAVEAAYENVLGWAGDGFGQGEDGWRRRALDVMITERNAAVFAGPEFSRIRLEISRRFGALDDFFSVQVRDMWDKVAAACREECGVLLGEDDGDGRTTLEHLAAAFAESAQPCPTLAASVGALLDVRLEYRTLLYPRVRADLGSLNLQVRHPQTGQQTQQVAVELTEDGAADLYRIIGGLAEQAAFRTRRSLLGERVTPAVVLQAVVEQFEDALIRSGPSVQEFRRFVRSYRNELWPEEFRGIDEANARYARVTRSITAITEELEGAA